MIRWRLVLPSSWLIGFGAATVYAIVRDEPAAADFMIVVYSAATTAAILTLVRPCR